jgi:hypothetical protein
MHLGSVVAQQHVRPAMTGAGEAMAKAASADGARAVVRRIGRPIQRDLFVMHKLGRAGIEPDAR